MNILLQVTPLEWKVYYQLAEVYKKMDKKEKALLCFDKAMELNPKDRNSIKQAKQSLFGFDDGCSDEDNNINNHNNNSNSNDHEMKTAVRPRQRQRQRQRQGRHRHATVGGVSVRSRIGATGAGNEAKEAEEEEEEEEED
ncbi:hypothetical protein RFI_33603, partial [Reticulomyxa filosa]